MESTSRVWFHRSEESSMNAFERPSDRGPSDSSIIVLAAMLVLVLSQKG
jgi:hypothetical protein